MGLLPRSDGCVLFNGSPGDADDGVARKKSPFPIWTASGIEFRIPEDYPARVVAAFVDSLSSAGVVGARHRPAQHADGCPRLPSPGPARRLALRLHERSRSTHKLEKACREQLPYLWLAGGQRPDHNTLWRFCRTIGSFSGACWPSCEQPRTNCAPQLLLQGWARVSRVLTS